MKKENRFSVIAFWIKTIESNPLSYKTSCRRSTKVDRALFGIIE